jgi:hypothetical protein
MIDVDWVACGSDIIILRHQGVRNFPNERVLVPNVTWEELGGCEAARVNRQWVQDLRDLCLERRVDELFYPLLNIGEWRTCPHFRQLKVKLRPVFAEQTPDDDRVQERRPVLRSLREAVQEKFLNRKNGVVCQKHARSEPAPIEHVLDGAPPFFSLPFSSTSVPVSGLFLCPARCARVR